MIYNEEIEQSLFKTIQKINAKNKDNCKSKILVPESVEIKLINKTKMFVMQLNEKPVSVHWLMKNKKY